MKINFLDETLAELKDRGLTEADIACVAFKDTYLTKDLKREPIDVKISWDKFKDYAASVEYDNDEEPVEIRQDLRIIFKDGSWFERASLDGSEWWEYTKAINWRLLKEKDDINLLNKDLIANEVIEPEIEENDENLDK